MSILALIIALVALTWFIALTGRQISIYGIEIYTRWQQAKIDIQNERTKALLAFHEIRIRQFQQNRLWQQQARQELRHNRQAMSLLTSPLADMWKSGKFDIELDQ